MAWLEDTFGGTDPYGITRATQAYEAWLNSPWGQKWQTDTDAANAEQQRRYNEEFGLRKKQLDQNYALALRNAKTQEEATRLNREYQRAQLQLAREQFEFNKGMEQSKLGLDYLKTQVDYQNSPDNYFKLMDLRAGASQRQDVPIFLQNLFSNVQAPAWQTPGGTPTPGSVQAGAAALTGQSSGASTASGAGSSAPKDPAMQAAIAALKASPPSGTQGYSDQDKDALAIIGAIYGRGFGALGPQALEQAGDVGQRLLGAGGRRLGYDPAMAQEDYTRSRWLGGGSGGYSAAAA